MNGLRSLVSARSLLRCWLALGATTLGASSAVEAQQLPQVGLSGHDARLLVEEGPEHNGPGAADYFGFAVAAGDFNHDGADDLASGIPGNDCNFQIWDCGSVVVRWGVPGQGLGATFTLLDQLNPASPDIAYALDEYGFALAAGDFDGDSRDDLAVGVPGNSHVFSSGTLQIGGVQLHLGNNTGINVGAAFFAPWDDVVPGSSFPQARHGHAVAFGDFNADGRQDLAMGAPGDVCTPPVCPTQGRSGSVTVLDRDAAGTLAGFEMVLGDQGLPDVAEEGEDFGWALATGDFDHDGFDDLAIGVPSEDDVGAVLVVYGSPFSLLFADHLYFGQWDLNGTTNPGGRFGEALAAGDFDHDGYDDLAVGSPQYDANATLTDIGIVSVVYGSQTGLSPARVSWLWDDLLFGGGHSAAGDRFGAALTAGDFDGDAIDDLVVGVAGDGFANLNAGAAIVLPGRQGLPLPGIARRLFPAGKGVPGSNTGLIPDSNGGQPRYGSALAAGDFDGNGFDDLAIGAPNRDVELPTPLVDPGAVAVLYGQLFIDGFETGSTLEWSIGAP